MTRINSLKNFSITRMFISLHVYVFIPLDFQIETEKDE